MQLYHTYDSESSYSVVSQLVSRFKITALDLVLAMERLPERSSIYNVNCTIFKNVHSALPVQGGPLSLQKSHVPIFANFDAIMTSCFYVLFEVHHTSYPVQKRSDFSPLLIFFCYQLLVLSNQPSICKIYFYYCCTETRTANSPV